jgi:hypothetical protein
MYQDEQHQRTEEFTIFDDTRTRPSTAVRCRNFTCHAIRDSVKYSFMTAAFLTAALSTIVVFFEIRPLSIPPLDIVIHIPPGMFG